MDFVAIVLVAVLLLILWHCMPEKFTPEQKILAMNGAMPFQYGVPVARIVRI